VGDAHADAEALSLRAAAHFSLWHGAAVRFGGRRSLLVARTTQFVNTVIKLLHFVSCTGSKESVDVVRGVEVVRGMQAPEAVRCTASRAFCACPLIFCCSLATPATLATGAKAAPAARWPTRVLGSILRYSHTLLTANSNSSQSISESSPSGVGSPTRRLACHFCSRTLVAPQVMRRS
jgi:hypothetical protein